MTTKIAVSLPDEQVEAARTAVAEGRAPSVSAYVSEALARRSAEDELLHLLDEDDSQEPTADEHRAWARRALLGAAPAPERRRVRVDQGARRPHRTEATRSTRGRSDMDRAREVAEELRAGQETARPRARRRRSTSDGPREK